MHKSALRKHFPLYAVMSQVPASDITIGSAVSVSVVSSIPRLAEHNFHIFNVNISTENNYPNNWWLQNKFLWNISQDQAYDFSI